MTTLPDDDRASLRRSIYWLLIAISAGAMMGRVLSVDAVDRQPIEQLHNARRLGERRKKLEAKKVSKEKIENDLKDLAVRLEIERPYDSRRPFLSANDRSRWCTVRALVEHGTYAIDEVTVERNWDTIDMVMHRGRDGRPHIYSSKPTLFPTLLAAEYWVIHKITGATLGSHPHEIVRFMLLSINVLPMLVFFVLAARLAEKYGTTDWGRTFVVAAATLGTLLGTFAVVLNNHLVGAVSVMIALYAAVRIWCEDERRLRYFAVAGLFAAFAASAELPALSLFALLSVALLWKAPRETLIAYVPAALVVAIAAVGTNYAAHDTLTPPYAHRAKAKATPDEKWYDHEYRHPDPKGTGVLFARWRDDNWYDFEHRLPGRPEPKRSYWANTEGRAAIDRGEPSRIVYAANVLVGHHGIFSLTPVWLLSLVGLGMLYRRGDRPLRGLAVAIALVSLVVIAFYLARPLQDRNYGGFTCGFRWAFWLAPLWLIAMLPAADWSAANRTRRCTATVLLGVSVLSASFPTWNPWTHPWLFKLVQHLG